MGTRGRTFLGSEAASDTSRPRPARRRGGDSWAELNPTRRFAVVPPNARPRRLGGRPQVQRLLDGKPTASVRFRLREGGGCRAQWPGLLRSLVAQRQKVNVEIADPAYLQA